MPKKRPPLVLLAHKHTLGPFSCIHFHNFPFKSLLGKEHACTCRKIKYGLSPPCHDRTKCRRGSDMQFSLRGRLCSHSKACGVMGCGLDWAISVIFAYVTPRVTNLPVRQRTKTERKLLADDMRNCAAANLNVHTNLTIYFFVPPSALSRGSRQSLQRSCICWIGFWMFLVCPMLFSYSPTSFNVLLFLCPIAHQPKKIDISQTNRHGSVTD